MRPRAGSRLVVGPRDLRRTNLADTFLYFLLPEYQPGTYYLEMAYYLEMEPGVANAPGSRLTDDLRHADVVILDERPDHWVERNASATPGSDGPNQVLLRDYVEVGSFGPWHLFTRVSNAPRR